MVGVETSGASRRSAHLLLGRVVDGCQGDEAGDMLSLLLENGVIPDDGADTIEARVERSPSSRQPTCTGPSRNGRPPAQQSGSEVSAWQRGWRQQSFRSFWCSPPAAQTGEESREPPTQKLDGGLSLPAGSRSAKLLAATVRSEGRRRRGTWNC